MPHVIVKLWPGKSEDQKARLAEAIAKDVMDVLGYGEESVSVAFEEVSSRDWAEKVYKPDIVNTSATLYKKPGYEMGVSRPCPYRDELTWPRPARSWPTSRRDDRAQPFQS